MRVLGVDPGSLATGWGLVEGSSARPSLVGCGVIRLPAGIGFAERLARLHAEFDELISRLQPAVAAVEAPFHGASARSALQLAHARGVVLAVLAGHGIEVAECSPAAVKKSVTGNGRAEKAQVRRMVCQLLGAGAEGQRDDATDALAVALFQQTAAGVHAAVRRTERRPRPLKRPKEPRA